MAIVRRRSPAASSGLAGSFGQGVDTANNYVAFVPASAPGTFYLNVLATGQNKSGFVSSVDTIRALRAHFDSAGGNHAARQHHGE